MPPFPMAINAVVAILDGSPSEPVILTMIISYVASFISLLFSSPVSTSKTTSCWRDTPCNVRTASFSGPWDTNNYSPKTRTVSPVTIFTEDFSVSMKYPKTADLSSNVLIYDFGKEVGGIVTVSYEATGSGHLGLAFSEARNWTGRASDGSNGRYIPRGDGALFAPIDNSTQSGTYTMPDEKMRGGFRYLSLFTTTDQAIKVQITSVTLELSFQPTWSDLRAYGGYFHSSDELLNRIWYAGAYTLQTNAVPPRTGRVWPLLEKGWRNDAWLGTNGSSIFVDGSKRDRATWAGDLGIALPSAFVSTGDFESARNALQLQYDLQSVHGELPVAGPPLNFFGSDTYHMASLIGTYEYLLYSGDMEFLAANWAKIKLAIRYVSNKIDPRSGALYVTGEADWGRYAQGGFNTAANAMMFRTLITGNLMAGWMGQPGQGARWEEMANVLKASMNSPALNWDPVVGAFKDSNIDASVYPEDGNSLALYYDMAFPTYYRNISDRLVTNWGPIGAKCPELSFNIVPFIESMEIKGHLAIGQTQRALALIRRSWGWYLNHPSGTQSTFIEGYLADGSFGYRAWTGYEHDYSYTSHAHGWSTGPTHALSHYVLGLQLASPAGADWILAPQFGDLTSAQGGFTTPRGPFSARWALRPGGYDLTYDVPVGTAGTLRLPAGSTTGPVPRVTVAGEVRLVDAYEVEKGVATLLGAVGGKVAIRVMYD
ncbi:bacterial alpha-L-rhamnosidase domain protein [Drepanopeziza brunnea f. sp. 'multigermtubi' MB_m1]|uniref:Bacterial alpha-L-rhamnosidase domain protein n=2 Tax=Drepanopeziza brunnea f. sp. 'multigermtubi' TaxID=698441 RepID=K1W784_MARBU|nr:bacterial alpha-L-rhamnosidase domain protein [Drepanopeziza brunnea f. sp. 'multigermtubi' MB_m1]EKD12920.1 bacterial alpha-L-rhamnosidase domain protein [Drepanopeziza brunnea f. sp. 'multigermtubi' MB_m1]